MFVWRKEFEGLKAEMVELRNRVQALENQKAVAEEATREARKKGFRGRLSWPQYLRWLEQTDGGKNVSSPAA